MDDGRVDTLRRGERPPERPRVTEWLLERLAAGDLPLARARQVQQHLEEGGELERLAAIEASNRAILAAHPPAAVDVEVRRRLARATETGAKNRAPRAWSSLALGGLAWALVSIVFVSTEPGSDGATPLRESEPTVRLKGLEPHLVIYKKTPAGAVRLASPARVAAGDLVQLAYVAAGRRYGVVASIDSRRSVTLHLPEASGSAALLVEQSETPLPHAFELDDAPGTERILFVTADHPFDVAVVISALREGAPLPRDVSTGHVHLEKHGHE